MFTFAQPHNTISSPALAYARIGAVLISVWYCSMGWLTTIFATEGSNRWWGGPLATLIAGGALLLIWLGYWRWAARWLVAGAVALTSFFAWDFAFQPFTSLLVLTVLVVFAGWTLGVLEASIAAVAVIVLGIGLIYRGYIDWAQVLSVGYVLLFLLGITWLMLQGYRRHLKELRESLGTLEQHKQQLHVLYQAVEQSPDCILIVDLQGNVIYANPAYEQRTGYLRSEVMGLPSRQVSLTGLTQAQHQEMRQTVESGKAWQDTVRNRLKNGEVVVDDVRIAPVLNAQGQVSYLVENRHDISQRLEAEDRIAHLQKHDSVTQLLNRQAVLDVLDEMLLALQSEHGPQPYVLNHDWHTLLLVEIDRYQNFEITRGRVWADALLQSFVERLRAVAPSTAKLARIRINQFAVIVPAVGQSRYAARMHAYAVAQELQEGLRMTQMTNLAEGPETVKLSCSVGFTVFPFIEDGLKSDSADHVLRRASVALSQALHQGGGQVHSYSELLDESIQRRMVVEKELLVALEEGQLQVFLQPQVDMNGRVAGAEALVRWKHPDKGMISPGEFIPVAESCGLIVPLGDWMMEQVCLLLNDPRVQEDGYGLSVNVSAVQFLQPQFVDKVRDVLQRTGAPAHQLTLEVTESLLLNDVDGAIQKMVALRALGVQFALDDFGTGYSSLAYLMRLPIQEIKLDQAFIRDLAPMSEHSVLVQALLMVASSKELRVVAEGVEQAAQAELLQAWEPSILCQGYLFSRPVLAQDWLLHPQLGKAM